MIIDIHTHTFPDRIAPSAVDKLKKASHCVSFSDGTRGGLLDSMHRAGVHRSVVLPVVTNPAKTSSINDISISLNGQDGLIYFGGIHPDTPEAEKELERIAQAGLKGIKIHPVYQGADIDDPRYVRILRRAGELGLIVLMHAGEDIGFPGVVRCSPDMTARALDKAGPVTIICAHMGGWRNWDMVTDCLCGRNVYLDTAFSLGEITPLEPDDYDNNFLHQMPGEVFCHLVNAFGSDHILFGSDSPWGDPADTIRLIRSMPLEKAQTDAILGGNAERLLGL
ncbi:MAG: amidohydrolase family protein [Clostridia bacterium]|nr:amidohydrolase family protein [Clostridia bacterium]